MLNYKCSWHSQYLFEFLRVYLVHEKMIDIQKVLSLEELEDPNRRQSRTKSK